MVLVFMGGNITEEHVAEFEKSPVPIVLAGSIEESKTIPSVNIDYEQAVFDAVKEFIEKGHKNIAFVVGPLHEPKNAEKSLNGYVTALQEASIPFNEELVLEGDYTYDSGLEAFDKLLEASESPQLS